MESNSKKPEKNINRDIRNMILVFLVAFIPRMILNIIWGYPFRTPMDEMSTVATGAYFGGADFTALTSAAGYYYGGGFTILLAPLFKLGLDGVVLYKIILIICSALQSFVAPMGYYILKKGFAIQNDLYNIMGAIVCSYCMVTRSMMIFNEHMLIFLCWCVALLFMKLCQSKDNYKKKSIYSVLLMLVFFYGITIHARFKVLWIGFVIILVLFWWMYKRLLVAGIPTVISALVFNLLSSKFNRMVQETIWLADENTKLHNTSTAISKKLELLKDIVSWEGLANTLIGQSNTVFIFTGGLLLIGVVVLFYIIIVNRRQYLRRSQERIYGFESMQKCEEIYMVIALFFFLCIAGTILAQGLRWLPKILNALRTAAYAENPYGFKAFTYVRYIGPLLGPFALSVIGVLYHCNHHIRRMVPCIVCAYGLIQLLWLAFVVPHISNASVAAEVFLPFSFHAYSGAGTARARWYLVGTFVAAVVFLIAIICYYYKKFTVPLILFALFISCQYIASAVGWDSVFSKRYVGRTNAGYECITSVDEKYDLPEEIYVLDTGTSVQSRRYAYQFLMYDTHRIIKFTADAAQDDTIVLCTQADNYELESLGYVWTTLDANEYLYVKGEKYRSVFEQEGFQFSE